MNRLGQILLGLLLVVAFVGATAFYLRGPGPAEGLALLEVDGEVSRVRGELTEDGRAGMRLEAGDEVRTGKAGTAVIARGSRSPLRLEASTTVRIESVSEDLVEVRLRRGRMRAKVRPDAGALRVLEGQRSVLATDAEIAVVADPGRMLAVEPVRGEVAVVGIPGAGRVRTGERLLDLAGRGARVVPLSAQPLLDVQWPEGSPEASITVGGTAEPGSLLVLTLAGQTVEVQVGLDGTFEVPVQVPPGEHEASAVLIDPMGRRRTAHGTLIRKDATAPRFELDLDYGGRR